MGAGGSQGTVIFPDYIAATHQVFMFGDVNDTPDVNDFPLFGLNNVATLLESALTTGRYLDGNPFDSQSYSNPNDDLVPALEGSVALIQAAADAFEAAGGGISDEVTTVDEWVDGAVATLDTSGVLAAIATQAADAQTSASSDLSTAEGDATAPMTPTDWATFWAAALTELSDLTNLVLVDIYADAATQATLDLTAAITQGAAAINESEVTAAIAAFTAANANERAVGIRQVAGALADVNAVQTSTFMVALGLAKLNESSNTAQFQAQLRIGLYQQGMTIYIQALTQDMDVSFQVDNLNKGAQDNVLLQGSNQQVQLAQIQSSYQSEFVNAFSQLTAQHTQSLYQARIVEKENRDRAVLATSRLMFDTQVAYLTTQSRITELRTETERIIHAMLWEYEGSSIDLEHLDAFWPWEVHNAANNILAGPAGMAAAIPPTKSKLGSAIGGALGGFAIGGPAGAAAGAAAGLLG